MDEDLPSPVTEYNGKPWRPYYKCP